MQRHEFELVLARDTLDRQAGVGPPLDERGGDVRLAPAAVVHGNLTIVVREAPQASQPQAPFGQTGSTVVVPKSDLDTKEPQQVTYMNGSPSLAEVASALGLLGLAPRELAGVLQALRSAGALEAEVVVQ